MRLRFKLRWLMILVAITAIALGPACRYIQTLRERRRYYTQSAWVSDLSRQIHTKKAALPRVSPAVRERARKAAAADARESARSQRLADRPWLASDPIKVPLPSSLLTPAPVPAPEPEPDEGDVPLMVDLTPLKSQMTPERYAEVEKSLRIASKLQARQKRRASTVDAMKKAIQGMDD